ncbi:MAG TPA: DoxX family membrane protein [Acidobacteria bacterium]|nr:DoxX family membrane protein [Acidobacteriota bacterium]
MSPPSFIATARFAKVLDRLSFIVPLLTRLTLGLAFVQTGLGKWQHFDRTVEFFATLGIPAPTVNVVFIATLELVGGAFLILGLLTRLTSAGLASTMVVALMTAERADVFSSWLPSSPTSPTDITSYTFLVFLLWLLFYGPGAASLDALIFRKRTAARNEAAAMGEAA